ncbi:MAG: ABC transporter permease [Actinobacteria bacterium]|nr:MAG: ABC transporter permease [Actinomycetota bacterium]
MTRILAIVRKDLRQILSNRFVAVITGLGLIFYPIVYYILPAQVDETFTLGLYVTQGREQIERQAQREEGLRLVFADSEEELRRMVLDKEVQAGFSLTRTGETPSAPNGIPSAILFVSSDTPQEVREAGQTLGRELAFALLGHELPVEFEPTVLGTDRLGEQIPFRNRLRVLLVVLVLVIEVFGMANLLSDEIQRRTVQALLVTPVTVRDFLTAKGVTGTLFAFVQGMIVAGLVRAITVDTLLPVTLLLLLGSLMVTGIGFLAGAVSRDIVSATLWGMLAIVVLAPGMSAAFPAGIYPLIQLFPTYHLVEPLDGIVNYGLPFSRYLPQVAALAGFDAALLLAGYAVLKRRLS